MIRTDIEIFIRKKTTVILTKDNQFTFALNGKKVYLFSTARLTMAAFAELEKSGIVEILHLRYDDESCLTVMKQKFGFSAEKFEHIIIYIIEKYNIC